MDEDQVRNAVLQSFVVPAEMVLGPGTSGEITLRHVEVWDDLLINTAKEMVEDMTKRMAGGI